MRKGERLSAPPVKKLGFAVYGVVEPGTLPFPRTVPLARVTRRVTGFQPGFPARSQSV